MTEVIDLSKFRQSDGLNPLKEAVDRIVQSVKPEKQNTGYLQALSAVRSNLRSIAAMPDPQGETEIDGIAVSDRLNMMGDWISEYMFIIQRCNEADEREDGGI